MNSRFCSSVPTAGSSDRPTWSRRSQRASCSGLGELLVQHDLLEQRQSFAAVFDGPSGADPAAGEELLVPALV